jgi:CII-binding regulator of phage lambda lysogenization HflD
MKYVSAVIAGLLAGLATLLTVMNNGITITEWLMVIIAFLAGTGLAQSYSNRLELNRQSELNKQSRIKRNVPVKLDEMQQLYVRLDAHIESLENQLNSLNTDVIGPLTERVTTLEEQQ